MQFAASYQRMNHYEARFRQFEADGNLSEDL